MRAPPRPRRPEAAALWRPAPEAGARAVVVTLGRATLVIADREGRALSHWSLPAVERIGDGPEGRARYAPGEGAGEVLELADAAMIEAIERVRRAVARRAPRRRWRRRLPGLALAAAAVAGAVALPEALRGHATRAAPPEIRAALGDAVLARLGPACEAPATRAALDTLARGLPPPPAPDAGAGPDEPPWRIVVLRGGPTGGAALPGAILALPADALESPAGPEDIAARLATSAEASDPLEALLAHAGAIEAARLLATARVSDRALDAYATHLAQRPAPTVDGDAPRDGSGPEAGGGSAVSDAARIALRGICEE